MSVQVNARVVVPEDELRFTYARSSGPGGQHVNRVETRVTLWFDVDGSRVLSAAQKRRVGERLATRINKDGELHVASQKHRSRAANQRAVRKRFAELLAWALARPRYRVPTKTPRSSKRRRLDDKRRRSDTKRGRSGRDWDG